MNPARKSWRIRGVKEVVRMVLQHHNKNVTVLIDLKSTRLDSFNAVLGRVDQMRATGRYADIRIRDGAIVAEVLA